MNIYLQIISISAGLLKYKRRIYLVKFLGNKCKRFFFLFAVFILKSKMLWSFLIFSIISKTNISFQCERIIYARFWNCSLCQSQIKLTILFLQQVLLFPGTNFFLIWLINTKRKSACLSLCNNELKLLI